jgi:hypothetical protein
MGRTGDLVQCFIGFASLNALQPFQRILQMPERRIAFVYRQGKRLDMPLHGLAHGLARHGEQFGHFGEPDEVGSGLDQLSLGNRAPHVGNRRPERFLGVLRLAIELQRKTARHAGSDRHIVAAGFCQTFDPVVRMLGSDRDAESERKFVVGFHRGPLRNRITGLPVPALACCVGIR